MFSDFKGRSRHEPPEQRLPVIVWSRLYFDLEPYLIERSADGAALLALYHRQLGTVAAAAYLAGDEQRRAHEHLAKYFAPQDYFLESVEVQRQRALATPPTPRLANRRKIDELCWQRLREAEETGACDVLEDTLGEFDAIEAAAEGGMLFGLLADFNSAVALISRQRAPQRVVQLIFEALRTDANFMVRHPTTALQCLWNHCWWVDCAGLEDHYVITQQESDAAPLPDHDELVSAIVRRWRGRKAEARLETPWLRSRRPPRVRLGSGQRAVLRGHQMGVLAVAVAENDRLVRASYDQTVRIWDLTTGAQLFCIATPAVWNLTVSPDGASVAASGREHITIWDAASGLERTVVASAQPTRGGLSFGSDSSQLLVLSPDGVLTVHDTASGGIVRKTLLNPRNIRQATFSPRADKVCLLTLANELIIVSLGSGDVVLCDRQLGSATGVAWSPDGRRVVTGGSDGTLCLLDVSSAKIVRRPNALDGTAEALSGCGLGLSGAMALVGSGVVVAFAPDGTRFAAARESGRVDEHLNSVVVFESVSLTEVRRLAGHEDLVRALCFCSDNLLASGSADMSVRLWDLTNEGGARYSLRYTGSPLYGVAQFVPDGRSIVQESIDSSKTVFDVETGRPLVHWRDHRWNISSPPGPVGPYDLISEGSETIVRLRATGDVVGWLPVRLHKFSIHPKRPLLAGHESESSYLHVYSIESEPAAPRIDGDPGEATTSFARLASLLRQEVSGSADELQKNQAVAAARGDWPQYGEFLAEEIAIWDRHGETEAASYLADVISRLPGARPVVRTTPSAPSTTAARERASSLFAAAQQSFRAGDLAGAVAKLEEAVVADPAFGPGHYSLCEYYTQMGRYDDAIRHATRAIECEPKDADAYNNRAVAYAEKRMPAEAEADFDNAIMLRPDFPMAIFNRGALHFNAGHVEAAARDWKRFLELKPQSERADFIRKVFAQIGITPAC